MSNSQLETGITFTLPPHISDGVASPTSAIRRPFRLLLESGKPIGKINYVFFNPKIGKTYLFGSFCLSEGGRLLFFPGLIGRKLLWINPQGKPYLPKGELDHISVESDLKTFHPTYLIQNKKEKYKKKLRIFALEDKLYFWFGMSIQKSDVLEKTPREAGWIFKSGFDLSDEEIKRRSNIIMASRENAIFNILELLQPLKHITDDSFIHFDVFIDKRTPFSLDGIDKTIAPFKKPSLIYDVPQRKHIPTRVHDVRVNDFEGRIVVVASNPGGKLSEKAIFGSM